jgi:ligand-binding sensor domain-containing protein
MTRTIRRFCIVLLLALAAAPGGRAADAWAHITREENPKLPGNEIQFLGPAVGGGVWVGTLAGAAKAKNGDLIPLDDGKGGVFKKSVWWVLDSAGRTWVGHQQGLREGTAGAWKDALPGLTVAPVFEAGPGLLWALGKHPATDAVTLFEYRDKEWKPAEALAKKRITNLHQTRNGRLWVTFDGNGVLEAEPAAGLAKGVHHLEGLNVTTVFQDSRNQVWCGLWAGGLAVWDGTAWKRDLAKEKKSAILTLVEDAGGGLWAATSGSGLWRRPAGRAEWENDLAGEGGMSLLAATADGRVWVSSQAAGGLRYWNGTAWVASLDSPLPIRSLVETADGTLWAGGVLDGLYVLKKGK